MNNKLISIALTGLLASTSISSAFGTNISIVGRIQAEYSGINIEGFSSQTTVNDPTFFSSWGIRAFEDLGNGFRVVTMIDFGFNTNGGSIGNREVFVGISKDSLGTLKFGRTHSPFADFAGGWTIDPFVYTTLQATGSGGTMIASANGLGSGSYSAVNSVVRFTSTTFNGFSFAVLLMPGDADKLEAHLGGHLGGHGNNIGDTGGENGEWDVQFAAKYVMDFQSHKLEVFSGYSRDNVSSAQKKITAFNLKTEEVGRIGGVWSYKNFSLQGQYDFISDALGAATCSDAAALGAIGDVSTRQCNTAMNPGGDGSIWYAGGQYRLGNTTLIAQGGMTDANKTDVFASRKSKSFTVGGLYHMSKRTNLFGGYQHVDVIDKNSIVDRDRNTWTVGMRHLF
ncbi:porin [Nitrosomonas sp. Nm132]|jgi:predicted porin|uniref:porin n=1 Tax=Nitrosomonas sp. Nm132 TaxID=1881053 RepID=UPI000880D700|nr:porin [Nitrosomonas sp. Nm132]SDI01782.1 Outer membrane protein (porin) [Nitrosomonas sp. Nm132]